MEFFYFIFKKKTVSNHSFLFVNYWTLSWNLLNYAGKSEYDDEYDLKKMIAINENDFNKK